MLVEVDDLPGTDWRELGTGSWVAGLGEKGALAERARKTGAYAALRRFRNDESEFGVDVQILPTANAADAETQVLTALSPEATTRWKGVATVKTDIINDLKVSGAYSLVAWYNLTERDGHRGHSRKVEGRVDRLVFWVQCSGFNEGPGWDLVADVAAAQVAKLRSYPLADSEQEPG
jgi:hypothetical protein